MVEHLAELGASRVVIVHHQLAEVEVWGQAIYANAATMLLTQ